MMVYGRMVVGNSLLVVVAAGGGADISGDIDGSVRDDENCNCYFPFSILTDE